MTRPLPLATQERIILSVLDAYKSKTFVPWGITELGWAHYTSHESEKVRTAALAHPHCPEHYRTPAAAKVA